jgi:hypothetical protein
MRIKVTGTIFYPLGVAFETMEGPFAGSAVLKNTLSYNIHSGWKDRLMLILNHGYYLVK